MMTKLTDCLKQPSQIGELPIGGPYGPAYNAEERCNGHRLFIDLDGVLGDFVQHYLEHFGHHPDSVSAEVKWAHLRRVERFFETIPPMPDFAELWHFVAPFKPIILTGYSQHVPQAPAQKRSWVQKHIDQAFRSPQATEVRCCASKEKYRHAAPGDILIDDWIQYKPLWEATGATWITHTSAKSSIADLCRHLREQNVQNQNLQECQQHGRQQAPHQLIHAALM